MRENTSSICTHHVLIQFKVVHHLHYSKAILARIYPNINPTCNRCNQAPATTYHMLWSWSKLVYFWKSFFITLSYVFNCSIQPSPITAIFGVIPCPDSINNPPMYLQHVIAFSSLLARRIILFKWKDTKSPTYSHWMRDMMQNIKLEKIRFTMNSSTNKFSKIWSPFIQYVNTLPGLELQSCMSGFYGC